jgi:hypothetical protein
MAVGVYVASAQGGQPRAAAARASDEVQDKWIVLEAGNQAKSLVIEYRAAPCSNGPTGRAHVHGTGSSITISVAQKISVTRNQFCDDVAYVPRLVVHLHKPIAGRTIMGEGFGWDLPRGSVDYLTRYVPDPPDPDIGLPLAPRVVGLSVAEATAVLAREGFKAEVHGPSLGTIVSQTPTRGRLASGTTPRTLYGGVVTLTSEA